MAWVVKHYTRGVNNTGPQETEQYLACINYNPYARSREDLVTLFEDHQSDAFIFQTQAAAEMAAVFIGGIVVEYNP